MSGKEFNTSHEMMRLFMGFIPARAIYIAAKLGIADQLEGREATATEIASNLDADASALHRVMRLLAGMGIFHQDENDRFSLTALGETLRSNSETSVRDFVLLYHEIQYPNMIHLADSVRTGNPVFAKTFGDTVFEYIQNTPEAARLFHAGLRSRARIDSRTILDAYDFGSAHRIVDVGGGSGALLSAIMARHSEVSGVLFDLPPAITEARSGKGGPLPRCDFVEGDFFDEVPEGADAYVLKLVLHDWADDDALRILENCRSAMGSKSRLLVIEGLIGPPNELSLTMISDLMVLASFMSKERTEAEYIKLFERAGLRHRRTIATMGELSILEASV